MSSLPSAYIIDHDGLELVIALIEIDRLLVHEETIPERLESLSKRIEDDGMQSAPILVDKNSLVVLDGMHRLQAMRKLGCRFICVCLLDYRHMSIEVHKWCRCVHGSFDEVEARKVTGRLGLQMNPYELLSDLESEKNFILLIKDKIYRLTADDKDVSNILKLSYELECSLLSMGYNVDHCTEDEALEKLRSGESTALFCPPLVEKEQILELASMGKVFTPKATRHLLPARPIQVNVPLNLLRNKKLTLEEANQVLSEMLHKRELRRYDPGRRWMGRTYNEVLYVFE
jgi:hypothetical protein